MGKAGHDVLRVIAGALTGVIVIGVIAIVVSQRSAAPQLVQSIGSATGSIIGAAANSPGTTAAASTPAAAVAQPPAVLTSYPGAGSLLPNPQYSVPISI